MDSSNRKQAADTEHHSTTILPIRTKRAASNDLNRPHDEPSSTSGRCSSATPYSYPNLDDCSARISKSAMNSIIRTTKPKDDGVFFSGTSRLSLSSGTDTSSTASWIRSTIFDLGDLQDSTSSPLYSPAPPHEPVLSGDIEVQDNTESPARDAHLRLKKQRVAARSLCEQELTDHDTSAPAYQASTSQASIATVQSREAASDAKTIPSPAAPAAEKGPSQVRRVSRPKTKSAAVTIPNPATPAAGKDPSQVQRASRSKTKSAEEAIPSPATPAAGNGPSQVQRASTPKTRSAKAPPRLGLREAADIELNQYPLSSGQEDATREMCEATIDSSPCQARSADNNVEILSIEGTAFQEPEFDLFHGKVASPTTIDQMLLEKITDKLSNQPLAERAKSKNKNNYVYIYKIKYPSSEKSHSRPSCVKIGYTSKVTSNRVKQWEQKCLLPINLISSSIHIPLRHALLAEKLIHTELYNVRRKYPCARCKQKSTTSPEKPKDHVEWFEIEEAKALEVAREWVEFFAMFESYDKEQRMMWPFWQKRYERLRQTLSKPDCWIQFRRPPGTWELRYYRFGREYLKVIKVWDQLIDCCGTFLKFLAEVLDCCGTFQIFLAKVLDLAALVVASIIIVVLYQNLGFIWAFGFALVVITLFFWVKGDSSEMSL